MTYICITVTHAACIKYSGKHTVKLVYKIFEINSLINQISNVFMYIPMTCISDTNTTLEQ